MLKITKLVNNGHIFFPLAVITINGTFYAGPEIKGEQYFQKAR
jgi:hypothetical protein